MLLNDLWHFFQETIFTLPDSTAADRSTFNFYCQELTGIDLPGAAEIRRKNLEAYVSSFAERPEMLLVGEAPGWRGCRFSGVPFTSEAQLCGGELPFQGMRSSLSSKAYREASATILWDTMRPLHPGFFIWNAFPLHLHQPGKPLSNRVPSRQEIRDGTQMLHQVVSLLAPRMVVAVGNSACAALDLAEIEHVTVRHPAHGGARDFRKGIESVKNHITIRG
jgi:uracil-DNA glycosylase